jgi:hypothetical protein
MTDTTRRSSLDAGRAAIGDPHWRQKRATAGFSWPQAGQTIISGSDGCKSAFFSGFRS